MTDTVTPLGRHPITTDMVIVGAGPTGLFAVFEAGLLGLECHLIDNLDRVGGQCAELYPDKPIYDIPGYPVINGQELVDRLEEQIRPFKPVFHLSQQAEALRRQENGRWHVATSAGTVFDTATVVIAAGAGSFVPKRPPLPGIERFEGSAVHYAVRRRADFVGQRLIIAGGGDSALDWTLNLLPDAARITLIHRRDQFRAAPDSVARMRGAVSEGRMDLVIGQVTGLCAEGEDFRGILVQNAAGETVEIPGDRFLAFYGLKTDLGPLAEWGINRERNLIPVDTEKFETSAPGVFAIGDIATYPGKLKLILSGFHEAALMAQAAFRYAKPEERLVFRYTTSSSELHRRLGVSG